MGKHAAIKLIIKITILEGGFVWVKIAQVNFKDGATERVIVKWVAITFCLSYAVCYMVMCYVFDDLVQHTYTNKHTHANTYTYIHIHNQYISTGSSSSNSNNNNKGRNINSHRIKVKEQSILQTPNFLNPAVFVH